MLRQRKAYRGGRGCGSKTNSQMSFHILAVLVVNNIKIKMDNKVNIK